jgi:hypothetical protein
VTHAEELYLREMYEQDSSFAYACSNDDLDRLLVLFGEMEPIIDAMNVRSDASIEQRAMDIGCSPGDFWYETMSDDDVIKGVVEL